MTAAIGRVLARDAVAPIDLPPTDNSAVDGFARLGVNEILAFTAAVNTPSRRVMDKIGMRFDPLASFDHPRIAAGDVLRRHVVYRLARPPRSDPPAD